METPAEQVGEVEGRHEKAPSPKTRREPGSRREYDFGVIRALRNQRGLTIEKFAKLCGLSYAPISRIETNQIKPNLETLDRIAEGLGISTHNLVAMAERRDASILRPRERRSGGFSVRTFVLPGIEIRAVRGAGGAALAEDVPADRDDVTYLVTAGCVDITVADATHRIAAGEALCLSGPVRASWTAVEDSDVVVILRGVSAAGA